MKAAKILLFVLLTAGALFGFGRFFLSQLGGTAGARGPAGILLAPPPGFRIEEMGDASRAEAARRLTDLLAAEPDAPRIGVHFTAGGSELYWLVDRSDGEQPLLEERSGGPSGTRVQTLWRGSVQRRLAWAAEHGEPDAPDLPPGEQKNLYH